MGMLEVVAPLCRAVNDDLCRPSALAFATCERLAEGTVVKMGISEVPCKAGAVGIGFETDETAGVSWWL
jgi:hypothetical protein